MKWYYASVYVLNNDQNVSHILPPTLEKYTSQNVSRKGVTTYMYNKNIARKDT